MSSTVVACLPYDIRVVDDTDATKMKGNYTTILIDILCDIISFIFWWAEISCCNIELITNAEGRSCGEGP